MSRFNRQMWEAAAWTFLQAFIATFAASFTTIADAEAMQGLAISAAIAGMAAALSLIKSYLVRNIGEQDSIFIGEE